MAVPNPERNWTRDGALSLTDTRGLLERKLADLDEWAKDNTLALAFLIATCGFLIGSCTGWMTYDRAMQCADRQVLIFEGATGHCVPANMFVPAGGDN